MNGICGKKHMLLFACTHKINVSAQSKEYTDLCLTDLALVVII